MAKNNNNTTTPVLENVEAAPVADFVLDETIETTGKAIVGSAELTSQATMLAADCLRAVIAGDADLKARATAVKESADYDSAVKLVESCIALPAFIATTDEAVLKRLLESKRSDRSRAKKIIGTTTGFLRFIGDVIAEALIRQQLGFEYKATATSIFDADNADSDSLGKKIRALQSKLCNLRKQGTFAPADWTGWTIISNVEDEIEDLQKRRPTSRTVSTKVVSTGDIRKALHAMSEDELKKLLDEARAMADATQANA